MRKKKQTYSSFLSSLTDKELLEEEMRLLLTRKHLDDSIYDLKKLMTSLVVFMARMNIEKLTRRYPAKVKEKVKRDGKRKRNHNPR